MSSLNGRRTGTAPIAAMLVALLAPTMVRGQAVTTPAPAIGKKATLKPGAVLKVGDRVVDSGAARHTYTVERASSNGDWLWLTSEKIGGWARAADVIPATQANPGSVVVLVDRGNAWQVRGELDKAIADYDEALRLEPGHISAHLNRGIAWQAKGDFDKAIADYTQAINRGMKTGQAQAEAQAYNNRGHAWEMKKDYDRAIADYSAAIRHRPGYVLSWLNRGSASKAKGDFDRAIADYNEAIRLDPKSPWPYAFEASILATATDPKILDGAKAVQLATKACELSGEPPAYLCEVRSAAHAAAGEAALAAQWKTKAEEAAAKASSSAATTQRPQGTPRQPPSSRAGASSGMFGGAAAGLTSGPLMDALVAPRGIGFGPGNGGANPSSFPGPVGGVPNSYYGANYVLPPSAGATVLPRSGINNVGYTSALPTYYGGNIPSSLGYSLVRPVDPSSYGANYSGMTVTTQGFTTATNAIGTSHYGANYSGTANFNPSPASGFFPTVPGGRSFYGADYNSTMGFTPGSVPSGTMGLGGFTPNAP